MHTQTYSLVVKLCMGDETKRVENSGRNPTAEILKSLSLRRDERRGKVQKIGANCGACVILYRVRYEMRRFCEWRVRWMRVYSLAPFSHTGGAVFADCGLSCNHIHTNTLPVYHTHTVSRVRRACTSCISTIAMQVVAYLWPQRDISMWATGAIIAPRWSTADLAQMRRTVVRVHYVYMFSWSPNFTCVSGCEIDSALARDKQVAIWHFLPSGVFAAENVMQISRGVGSRLRFLSLSRYEWEVGENQSAKIYKIQGNSRLWQRFWKLAQRH